MSKQKYLLGDNQVECILKLINEEKELNLANGDGSYNTYWDYVITALGYQVEATENEKPKENK